jgi:hypothetical protein
MFSKARALPTLVKGIFHHPKVKPRFIPVHLPLHFQMQPMEIFTMVKSNPKKFKVF